VVRICRCADHGDDHHGDDHHGSSKSSSKPWGEAMGAAAVVNVVTLTGVAMLVPVVAKSIEAYPKYFEVVGTSFAGGALLSTAALLLLYESNHLIPVTQKQTEGMAAAIWGSMVLLGALSPSTSPSPSQSPARGCSRRTAHPAVQLLPLPLAPAHSHLTHPHLLRGRLPGVVRRGPGRARRAHPAQDAPTAVSRVRRGEGADRGGDEAGASPVSRASRWSAKVASRSSDGGGGVEGRLFRSIETCESRWLARGLSPPADAWP
jgi:hypothetical protein